MTDESLSVNGNLGMLTRLSGEIRPWVFWDLKYPSVVCGCFRRKVCAEEKQERLKEGQRNLRGMSTVGGQSTREAI